MARKNGSPGKTRAVLAQAKTPGIISGSAIDRLVSRFTSIESVETFARWRTLPETVLLLEVLRELSLNPGYVSPETDSFEVQFGLTSGFQTAAQIIDDPSSIFHNLFTGKAGRATPSTSSSLDTDYNQAPDEAYPIQSE